MRETGREFADVLAEAQALGYAEADPSFDVDGIDAAHKLALLAALAFGGRPRFDAIHIEGIRHVSRLDIAFATELGYRIKLLGVARMTATGSSSGCIPAWSGSTAPISQVEGVFNGVVVEGDQVGLDATRAAAPAPARPPRPWSPTSSTSPAALSPPVFGVPAGGSRRCRSRRWPRTTAAIISASWWWTEPGVLADVVGLLRDHEVSIESLIQRGRNPGEPVPIVLTSHETTEARCAARWTGSRRWPRCWSRRG